MGSFKSPRSSGKYSAKLDTTVGGFTPEGVFKFSKKVEIRKMHMYYRLLADNRARFIVKQGSGKADNHKGVEENQGQVQMNEEIKEGSTHKPTQKLEQFLLTKPHSDFSKNPKTHPEPHSRSIKTEINNLPLEKLPLTPKIFKNPSEPVEYMKTTDSDQLPKAHSSPAKTSDQSQQDFSKINGITKKTPMKVI